MLLLAELQEKRERYQKKISKDAVYKHLKKRKDYQNDIEMAMELKLPVSLVRNELKRLVDLDKVQVSNLPSQGKLESGGLKYRCVQKH